MVWVVGLALLAAGWRALPAQIAHQHQHPHPPQDVDAYIRVLEDPSRDEWQRPDQVVYNLDLKAGDEVADLGAGSGYFTIRLAKEVGPGGKVYAVDLEQKMLDYIEQRAREEQIDNIQTILADPNDPKLGSASVDMIFTCNTLHHIDKRAQYYALLLRALRPGGRLVNIDFHKRKLPVGPPVEMKIEKRECIKEIEAAGFHLLREFDNLKYQYFLIFELEG
jgi:ubiquinone/menaquinone biosynthesis C-methylase UbiE